MDPIDPPAAAVPAQAPAAVPATTVIYDRRRELRVKIKSLAQEARIIRSEERRCLQGIANAVIYNAEQNAMVPIWPEQRAALAASFARLRLHRIGDVRRESRYSLLAYAVLRGRQWAQVERSAKAPELGKLTEIVQRFGWCSAEKAAAMVAAFLGPITTAAVEAKP